MIFANIPANTSMAGRGGCGLACNDGRVDERHGSSGAQVNSSLSKQFIKSAEIMIAK
jgi:hypothetical protein